MLPRYHGFLLAPGSISIPHPYSESSFRPRKCRRVLRRPPTRHASTPCASSGQGPQRLSLPKTLLLAASSVLSTTLAPISAIRAGFSAPYAAIPSPTIEVKDNTKTGFSNAIRPIRVSVATVGTPGTDTISLGELDIKRDEYMSERELRRRKTTQFSEAEQEIMELEEWEVHTQWFRDFQLMWTAIASVGGIYILYKGGVMWEKWIKEQEQKDMEEEIELTGTFIDPRAVRKDDEDNSGNRPNKSQDGGNNPGKGPDTDSGSGPDGGDFKQGDLESLEKLFGKS